MGMVGHGRQEEREEEEESGGNLACLLLILFKVQPMDSITIFYRVCFLTKHGCNKVDNNTYNKKAVLQIYYATAYLIEDLCILSIANKIADGKQLIVLCFVTPERE